jgi:chorismate mutase
MAAALKMDPPDAVWLRLAIDTRRKEIADVDTELVRLIRKRVVAARQLGNLKSEAGLPIAQPAQEEAVLTRWREAAGELDPTAIERVAGIVMALCREAQG